MSSGLWHGKCISLTKVSTPTNSTQWLDLPSQEPKVTNIIMLPRGLFETLSSYVRLFQCLPNL